MMQRLVPLSMAIIGVFLASCDWMPGKPTRAQESVLPTDVHAFNTLYSANCSGCHGTNGQFGAARPLNDPLYLSLADTAYLVQITSDGVHGSLMPPFAREQGGGLTNQQVSDIDDEVTIGVTGARIVLVGDDQVADEGLVLDRQVVLIIDDLAVGDIATRHGKYLESIDGVR